MCAPSPAVRPSAGGVPRRAAAATSDASDRASSGRKRPRVGVAPARDSSACLTKTTRNRNSVVTAAGMEVLTVGGEISSQELLQKRLASELDVLRALLKKAELISRRGACKGGAGAPTAGKKERFLAPKQRPKPIEDGGGNAPSLKRRKISTLVEQKQKQIPAPRMSPEERIQFARRLSSLCGQLPGHIVEFLEKQFGDADSHGEIEINMDSVDDSVLFELKTRLDKFAEESKDKKFAEQSKDNKLAEETKGNKLAEETKDKKFAEQSKDNKLAEESKGEVVLELEEGECVDRPAQVPPEKEQIIATSAQPPSEPAQAVQQNTEAKKVQDVQQRAAPKAVYMPGLLYRAKLRRQLLEMERAKLPDQSIHPRDLQRLGIAEYGHPSVMRQIGLVLKVDDDA